LRNTRIRWLFCAAGLWAGIDITNALAVNQSDADTGSAVDFGPGCKLPVAVYEPPGAPFSKEPVGHSYTLLDLIVTKEGTPVDIHVLSGSSSKAEAIEAINQLAAEKFRPGECNGEIVAIKIRTKQDFTRKPQNCPPTGCTVPELPENPAIAGFRLPKPTVPPRPTIQELNRERQYVTRVLESVETMRNASSFAARVRIYCRSQRLAIPMLPLLGTVEDLEISYSSTVSGLMRAEPSTREEEVRRQYTLSAWRERLSAAYENANTCEGAITTGFEPLPTKEQENEIAALARTRIAEIDQELARRK
jgi:hypothetical protein